MDRRKKRKYTKKQNKKITVLSVLQRIFEYEIKIKLISFKTLLGVLAIALFYAVSSLYFYALKDLPSPEQLAKCDPKQTTTIYDRKGNVLYRIYSDEDRTVAKIEEIPQSVINATIAIEDQSFWNSSCRKIHLIRQRPRRWINNHTAVSKKYTFDTRKDMGEKSQRSCNCSGS